MKVVVGLGIAVLGALMVGEAGAQGRGGAPLAVGCVHGGTLVTDVATLLNGKTVCAAYQGDQWQEWHDTNLPMGGDLYDFKKGGNLSDPTEKVGTWEVILGGSGVRYLYSPTHIYDYVVCDTGGGVYTFESQTDAAVVITGATLLGPSVSPQQCP